MHFNVSVKASTYARYYFSLREKFGDFPLKPMSRKTAQRLEAVPPSPLRPTQYPTESDNNFKLTKSKGVGNSYVLIDILSQYKSPAAPATLPGVESETTSLLLQQSMSGIRRVKSDFTLKDTSCPASVM
jgi:hypothetical protein